MATKLCTGCGIEKPWSEYHMRAAAQGQRRPQTRCKTCANKARAERAKRPKDHQSDNEMVDRAPFAAWLRHVMWRDQVRQEELAVRLRLNERQVRTLLHGPGARVTVRLVDRVLCHEGTATLVDLYPSLYGGLH